MKTGMKANPRIGSIIADNYQLLSIAGSGGMGTVYKAKQLGLERLVAIKVLDPLRVADDDSRIRFEREAKLISSLLHAHITGFYAFGVLENGIPYIVMEWLDGQSLTTVIQNENGISSDRVIKITLQIAEALGAAHRSGIIHRDLKPANVLLLSTPEPDYVKIVDFGLARIESNSESTEQKLTKTGYLLGTPNYLSPELFKGARADVRSDIYALGCVLYEMICGEAPFIADNPIAVVYKHANEKVTPLSRKTKVPLPDGLESIVQRCLEKSPQDRYQNMDELHRDLLKVRDPNNVSSLSLSSEDREPRKKGILAPAVALATLIMVLIYVATQWLGSESGLVARAEFMLKNDYSRRNILDCLDISERLARQGKRASADRIEQAVDHALKVDSMEAKQAVKFYLDLAGDLKNRGDNEGAFNYAFKALKVLHVLISTANTMKELDKNKQLIGLSDDASELIIRSRQTMSKDQLKIAIAIAMRQGWLPECGNGHLLDIILDVISKNAVPLSDEILHCMFARDIIAAKHAPLAELDKMLNRSIKALGKHQGITTIRCAPAPCLPWHLCGIARIVFDRDHSACRRYVQLADDILQKVDWTKQTEKDPLGRAEYCNRMAEVYIGIREPQNALAYSREAVSLRPLHMAGSESLSVRKAVSLTLLESIGNAAPCPEIEEQLNELAATSVSARYLMTFSKALFLSGALAEAETAATNAYAFFKAQDQSDPYVRKFRSLCVLQLFQIHTGLNKSTAAIGLINSELKEQIKHLPATAESVADLDWCLLDYYVNHAQLRRAADYAVRINEIKNKFLSGISRVHFDIVLVGYARGSRDAKLATESVVDALAYLNTSMIRQESTEARQSWLDQFCATLRILKTSAEPQVYSQTLHLIQEGFTQQLDNAEPAYLARLVNYLVDAGEEKIADRLRLQATVKLPPKRASAFSAQVIRD